LTTLENKAFFKDGQQKQGLFAFDKSKLTTTKSGHLARYLIGGNMVIEPNDDQQRAFSFQCSAMSLEKQNSALQVELDRLRGIIERQQTEVERLRALVRDAYLEGYGRLGSWDRRESSWNASESKHHLG
jgi:hypothetical protein